MFNVSKRTDSQEQILQISSGLSFNAVLNIRGIDLLVEVKHCGRGDT